MKRLFSEIVLAGCGILIIGTLPGERPGEPPRL